MPEIRVRDPVRTKRSQVRSIEGRYREMGRGVRQELGPRGTWAWDNQATRFLCAPHGRRVDAEAALQGASGVLPQQLWHQPKLSGTDEAAHEW